MWSWPPTVILNISVDGVFVERFNPVENSFTLSNLKPGEVHTITLLSLLDSGNNVTYTLADPNEESISHLLFLLSNWGYLILILLLCVIGMMRRLGIFLIIASAVSCVALAEFITNNVIDKGQTFIEVQFLIYVSFFIIPLWLCFGVKKGVFS